MEFSGDCQGISGHFRTFGDSVGTQLPQIGLVYAIGCVGADFFIGSNGEAYECELRSGFTRDRAHGGKTFPLVAKTSLKRRGCATIARHGFRMRLRRRFYITMGLEDRAFQEKLRELGIERPGK